MDGGLGELGCDGRVAAVTNTAAVALADVVPRSDVGNGKLFAADAFEQRSHQWDGLLVRAGVRQTIKGVGCGDAKAAGQC